MARYTPAEANKILRRLQNEENLILENENKSSTYIVAHVEDPESVRPKYDFLETQKRLARIRNNIYLVKHAINQFNIKTKIPDVSITIDQALVALPSLTERLKVLREMVARTQKERIDDRYRSSPLVEYRYINYNVEEVKEYFDFITELVNKIRIGLDTVNNTYRRITFELE